MIEIVIVLGATYVACGIAYIGWDVSVHPYIWKDDTWPVQTFVVFVLLIAWPLGMYVDGYIIKRKK